MKRYIFSLFLAVMLPLEVSAYEFVDSLTYYAIRSDEPVLDRYFLPISPNGIYYAADPAQATHIAKICINGDTSIVMYYLLSGSAGLEKIERYQKTDEGVTYRSGLSEYYQDGVRYCTEAYRKGHLTSAIWYDAEGMQMRRYKFADDKVKQFVEMYPGMKQIMRIEEYAADTIASAKYFDKQGQEVPPSEVQLPVRKPQGDEIIGEDAILAVAESMPEFPGGQPALFEYLSNNIKYPMKAQNAGAEGRSVCTFVVNRDGSICDVEIARSSGNQWLDDEAVRVVKSMPRWKPGTQSGKPVRVRYIVPVTFSLSGKKRLSYCQTFADIWQLATPVISADFQEDGLGIQKIIENKDFCPYTHKSEYIDVMPGVHNERLNFGESSYTKADAQFKKSQAAKFQHEIFAVKYGRMLRGLAMNEKKLKNSYAFPFKPGTSATVSFADTENEHIQFSARQGDTICAVRSGVVCLSGCPNGVIMYHKDGSFCVYKGLQESLVKGGDNVNVGQPIGLAMSDGLSIYFLYLDKSKMHVKEESSNPYTFFYPHLQTENGFLPEAKDTTLVVPPINKEIIILDVPKSERAKFK